MSAPLLPAFVRGELHTDPAVTHGGDRPFRSPDPQALAPRLPLLDPVALRDLNALSTADVVDVLAAAGERMHPDRNEILAEALSTLDGFADLTPELLRSTYEQLPSFFAADALHEVAERGVGTAYLDGWVPRGAFGRVRAFGARTVHVIAGNNPVIAAMTIVRNALCRSDAVIKLPANDPVTAVAIARTLAEVAGADHPLVRHLAVAYWKGGDTAFEARLYHPATVEKIVAWGGFASVRHVTGYLRPGLELIALDPKLSATVLGPEAFADEATMRLTAERAAADVGLINQDACFNARVVYVVTGTDPAGIERANRWGELLHAAVRALPARVSTPVRRFDPELAQDIAALRTSPDFYRVFGGRDGAGAVLVSQDDTEVDFHTALTGRVANVVPLDDARAAVRRMNSYTQTVGVWPDSLRHTLRELAPLYGAQRLVPLGYATHVRPELPQDGMEPMRRMVKWIVDESVDPAVHHPFDQLAPRAASRA